MVPMMSARASSLRSRACGRGEYRLRADGMLTRPPRLLSFMRWQSWGISIAALFAGGLVAGVLWALAVCWSRWWVAKRRNYRVSSPSKSAWR
ncbi:hypothetical protein KCP71_05170 [Salmonella enterica subsp. enterica]|nr:hypothetical protein KCP71_05170 [Salmonella enterica subsp. enterica]